MGNILDPNFRRKVIDSIKSTKNVDRKMESLKRFEIYKRRLDDYVKDILKNQSESSIVDEMRVISSINLTPRIIDEKSSLYLDSPVRDFSNTDEKELERIEALYASSKVDIALKKANKFFKLMNQCTIQVVPKKGKLRMRVLAPHHFDVVPMGDDPEEAAVYILSQFDKDQLFNEIPLSRTPNVTKVRGDANDRQNTPIGDKDDWKALEERFVWWSNDFNFVTDGNGSILNENMVAVDTVDEAEILNPIGQLPFVDVAEDKDFEYWNRYGNSVTDFTLDFSLILSDLVDTMRIQGHATGVFSASEPPKDIKIGPRRILFLKKKPNAEASEQPEFSYTSPNADLASSKDIITALLSMYLTSDNLDPDLVNADGNSASFASGVDHLLSNIDKFKASKDDMDLFRSVEQDVFELFRAWLDAFAGVTVGGLDDEIAGPLPEDIKLAVEFKEPSSKLSEKEKEESVQRRLELGVISDIDAIMELKGVDRDRALEIKEQIEEDIGLDGQSPEAEIKGQTSES